MQGEWKKKNHNKLQLYVFILISNIQTRMHNIEGKNQLK
jgi:hypothetical protein